MTLVEARKLRDWIREHGIHSVTPLGFGPDGYFARIWTFYAGNNGRLDFYSVDEWEKYLAVREAEREAEKRKLVSRSPLDRMIDQACGVKDGDYR